MKLGLILAVALWAAAASAAEVVTEAAIHRAVENFVRAALQERLEEGERVKVHTRWQGDVPLEGSGDVEVAVRRLSARPLSGPTVMRVALVVDGKTQREMGITADVRFFRRVLVASRMVRRGEPLAAELVERAERDVTMMKHGFYTDTAELVDLRTRRAVGLGDVLTPRHTEKIPVVRRGDEIALVAETPNLRISTTGVALQDGGMGERIRVRNQDSGKVVYGEVVDPQTIKVGL